MSHKILVIEDEPTLARLLSYNLTQEGYDTKVIDHGSDGLQAALHQPFDLIILDIMLPGMNGFEILSRLRQKGIKTPVIILTARNAEEEIVQGLKYGADDYITKPFGVAELLLAYRRYFAAPCRTMRLRTSPEMMIKSLL